MSSAMTMLPVAATVTRPRTVPLIATSPSTKITPLNDGFSARVMGNRYSLSGLPLRSGLTGPDHLSQRPRLSVGVNPLNRTGSPPRKHRWPWLDRAAIQLSLPSLGWSAAETNTPLWKCPQLRELRRLAGGAAATNQSRWLELVTT